MDLVTEVTAPIAGIGIPPNGRKPAPRPVIAQATRAVARVVRSLRLLDQLSLARRETYARMGVVLHDEALDAQRRFGTTLGLFVEDRLIGAFSAWRLSEALCSLGFLLTGVGIEDHDPSKVVEVASLFVLPQFAGRGLTRLLLEGGRVLVAGMKPELLVAFAVRSVVDRYITEFGFRSVGPFTHHPLARSVEVMPLVATYEEFAAKHFA